MILMRELEYLMKNIKHKGAGTAVGVVISLAMRKSDGIVRHSLHYLKTNKKQSPWGQ